jgi:hypothetical protein
MVKFSKKYLISSFFTPSFFKFGLDRGAKSFALISNLFIINFFFNKNLATELNYLFAISFFFQIVLIQTYENISINSLKRSRYKLFINILFSKLFFSLILYILSLLTFILSPLSNEITFFWGAFYLTAVIFQSFDTIDYFTISKGGILKLALIRWINFILFFLLKIYLLQNDHDYSSFLSLNIFEYTIFYTSLFIINYKNIKNKFNFLHLKIFYTKKVLFSFLISMSAVISNKIDTIMFPYLFHFNDVNQYLTLSRIADFFVAIVCVIPLAVSLTIHKESSLKNLRYLLYKTLFHIFICASAILILFIFVFINRKLFFEGLLDKFFVDYNVYLLIILMLKIFFAPIGGILGVLWVKFKLLKLSFYITIIAAIFQFFIVLISGFYKNIYFYASASTFFAAFTTVIMPFFFKSFLDKLKESH